MFSGFPPLGLHRQTRGSVGQQEAWVKHIGSVGKIHGSLGQIHGSVGQTHGSVGQQVTWVKHMGLWDKHMGLWDKGNGLKKQKYSKLCHIYILLKI